MRTETITRTYYLYDELDDVQKEKAVDLYRDWAFLHRDYSEEISEAIIASLCDSMGVEYDGYGTALPNGIEVVGWDVDRGQSVTLDGDLYPDEDMRFNLPAGVDAVYFSGRRGEIRVQIDDDIPGYEDVEREAHDLIYGWLQDAVIAGRKEYEYQTSDEAVVDEIVVNDVEFLVDEDGRVTLA